MSLENFKSPQRLNQRQSCWHYELALNRFTIEYKRGQLDVIADLLCSDPGHAYDPKELDIFNNVTLLPDSLFSIETSLSPYTKKFLRLRALTSLP